MIDGLSCSVCGRAVGVIIDPDPPELTPLQSPNPGETIIPIEPGRMLVMMCEHPLGTRLNFNPPSQHEVTEDTKP